MISNKLLSIITGIAAILITCIAAYFSIYGLSILFSGSKIAVIIMATSLEFGKIVLITYLYRNWSNISKLFKAYYLAGAFVLMSITSLGIYGFLNYSYSVIAKDNIIANNEIKTLEIKKSLYVSNIANAKENLNNKYKLINSSNTRLDSSYANNRTRNIKSNEKFLASNNKDVNTIINDINNYNDSLSVYESRIAIMNNKISGSDLGPLIFVAKLFNTTIDKIVNILILLIIFVFDPLAIMLLIAFNNIDIVKNLYKKPEDIDENHEEISSEINSDINIPNEGIIAQIEDKPEEIIQTGARSDGGIWAN